MTTIETELHTPDDVLRLEEQGLYELVDGHLVEKPKPSAAGFQISGIQVGTPGEVFYASTIIESRSRARASCSIWRTRSRVRPMRTPISFSVIGSSPSRP